MAPSISWAGWRRMLPAATAMSLLAVQGAAQGKTAADYFVHSLPGAPDGPLVKMHAG
jgi:carboxypeptidase D